MDEKDTLKKFKNIYNNTYRYKKFPVGINTSGKIEIICPKHGVFSKSINNHLHGQGYPKCKIVNKCKEKYEQFVSDGKTIHKNKYDYSKVEYKGYHEKVCIICPEHGEFWQTPSSHISQKCGCPKCSKTHKMNTQDFIEQAKRVHDKEYDYSKVEYINSRTKVCIICPEHGEFWQTPNAHITAKHNCPKCAHPSQRKNQEDFIKNAIVVHGNKYDYSKVKYINKNTKVCIICPEHGEFWQIPYKHYGDKQGCPLCSKYHKLNNESFIERAKKIHGDEYNYSKVEYKNIDTKVCIICPEHGEFWQTPHSHLHEQGCPKCSGEKNINETHLYTFLKEKLHCNIINQYKSDWLGKQSIDVFIPSKNIGIEYQGIQHFKAVKYFGGEKKLKYTKEKDKEKYDKCVHNGVKLFYFSKEKSAPSEYIDRIYNNEQELLEEILKYGDD